MEPNKLYNPISLDGVNKVGRRKNYEKISLKTSTHGSPWACFGGWSVANPFINQFKV